MKDYEPQASDDLGSSLVETALPLSERERVVDPRFAGIERLYGLGSLERLAKSHVAVVGLGGVGSWVAEALARTGVGQITLVDFDDICLSNTTRQIHALSNTLGKLKTDVMAERLRQIHPELEIRILPWPYTQERAAEFFSSSYDVVVDAIDHMPDKISLIVEATRRGVPLVTTGGAGGRRDPGKVVVGDLALSDQDRFLARLRKLLRQRHGFSRKLGEPFGIPCVYTREPAHYPTPEGTVSTDPQYRQSRPLDCSTGLGTASFVTGVFGFMAAEQAVSQLLSR